jgi:hypothetical protein
MKITILVFGLIALLGVTTAIEGEPIPNNETVQILPIGKISETKNVLPFIEKTIKNVESHISDNNSDSNEEIIEIKNVLYELTENLKPKDEDDSAEYSEIDEYNDYPENPNNLIVAGKPTTGIKW